MNPTIEAFRHDGTGQTKYKVGIDGVKRHLIMDAAELGALRSLIERVQEDGTRGPIRT